MSKLILSSLFLTTVNCQLAYIWLNYHHFQCSQSTHNYRESIRHQYWCTSSLIWTCLFDVNDYSHNANIFLDYFCGFIDGQNALQPHTIWNIHLNPNVKIHFLKFDLLEHYWYCDYEYLRVYSSNKTTTYCGLRLPWVHDALDTRVKIILMTKRTDTKNYQLEFLYYGAHYISNYQHFIIFTDSSSLTNMHYPNTEQNAFESFHFITHNRLDIMKLETMNTRSKGQVVCYDGPGFKSPLLQFIYNQSGWECLSSTFQMMCKFSREDDIYTNGHRLYYRAIRARDHQIKKLGKIKEYHSKYYINLHIDEAHSKGTTKYIFYHTRKSLRKWRLLVYIIPISFPYMLIEGNGCMYGGVYIVQTTSSKDSEIPSFCTPIIERVSIELRNIAVMIVHYREYSSEKIKFHALCYKSYLYRYMDLNQKRKDNILHITLPNFMIYKNRIDVKGIIHPFLLKLKKIQYINISCDALLNIEFEGFLRTSCMNITIFYYPHASNIFGRQYDQQTISGQGHFATGRDFIRSVFIDMSACTLVRVPVWEITVLHKYGLILGEPKGKPGNFTSSLYLPADIVHVIIEAFNKLSFWAMVHMLKPEGVPAYAIWRVFSESIDPTASVFMEVHIDNHNSSSVYEWNNFRSPDGVYITVDKAVNILIESHMDHPMPHDICIWFMRHFLHDDKINKYINGQAPRQSHFSFHNQR